jgi:hypothetical protein
MSCEHCGQHIEFPAEAVGVKVACPHCASETTLVGELGESPAEADEITAAELKAALEGVVPRRRISVFYRVGLLLVALFMILLPVGYLAFATFAGYCVWWYAVHARAIFSSVSGAYVAM